jgi:hypothetical protein
MVSVISDIIPNGKAIRKPIVGKNKPVQLIVIESIKYKHINK